MTRAPQLRSIRSRVAGMLPPGSPATISTRTLLSASGRPGRSCGGDLRQPQRVGRRAADDGRRRPPRSSPAACWLDMPPPGTQCRPIWQPASKPAQKPRNGPNENGKNTRSPAPTRARAIDRLPAVEHPLPALVGVDPAQRPAGRRRGLAVARVALERLGQRRAPRRIRRLIGDQLRLRRQRQRREIVAATAARRRRCRPRRACACRTRCVRGSRASELGAAARPCDAPSARPDRGRSARHHLRRRRLPRPANRAAISAESAPPSSARPAAARRRRWSAMPVAMASPSRVSAQRVANRPVRDADDADAGRRTRPRSAAAGGTRTRRPRAESRHSFRAARC